MKKLVYLTLLLGGFAFGQEQLRYGTGGAVYGSENQRISPDRVRGLMKDNHEALKLYNAGRRKKTFGNALFYGGIGLAAINLYQGTYQDRTTIGSSGYPESESVEPTLAIVGGVLFLASIPIKIGFPKRIKKAIELYNQGIVPEKKDDVSMTVLVDGRGVGFKIQF